MGDTLDEEAVSEAYTASEEYWHTEGATGRGATRVAIQTYLAALPKGEPGWRAKTMGDLEYLLACAEAHADKFPVPDHMRLLVARVRAALPKGEPVGWKLVPVEPTDAMIDAGFGTDGRRFGRDRWRAMVNAAPPTGDEHKPQPVWTDESRAMHWIDRYAAGIDDEPQMSRILACVGFAAPPAGDER